MPQAPCCTSPLPWLLWRTRGLDQHQDKHLDWQQEDHPSSSSWLMSPSLSQAGDTCTISPILTRAPGYQLHACFTAERTGAGRGATCSGSQGASASYCHHNKPPRTPRLNVNTYCLAGLQVRSPMWFPWAKSQVSAMLGRLQERVLPCAASGGAYVLGSRPVSHHSNLCFPPHIFSSQP